MESDGKSFYSTLHDYSIYSSFEKKDASENI